MKVSYSRVSSYLTCPYKHFMSYYECLKLNKPIKPLYFGTDFHKLLELRQDPSAVKLAVAEVKDKYYSMPSSHQNELGEDYVEDLVSIFEDYQEVYKTYKKPSITEHKFELPIGSINGEKVIFTGVIDELYKSKQGQQKILRIGEHKTFNQRPDMNTLVMNTQKCLYAKAALFLYGVLPKSVIWDYIKSTPANQPVWLPKSNKFSMANSSLITPMSWKRACALKDQKDENVLAFGETYKANITNFFFRVDMELVPEMVEDIWQGFMYTSKEILLRGRKNKTKNVTRDCKWCTFRDICFTEMTGGDRNEIISQAFIVEPREQEEETD